MLACIGGSGYSYETKVQKQKFNISSKTLEWLRNSRHEMVFYNRTF